MDNYRAYWKEHWQSHNKLDNTDPQKQVARTKFGEPISAEDWRNTCEYVLGQLNPSSADVILDLCCGNGLLTAYLINYVAGIIAIDYSQKLLDDFVITNDRINTVMADATDLNYDQLRFDRAVMYFSAQHFDETAIISIIKGVFEALPKGGVFLIGDIPDIDRKWGYLHKPEYREFYFSCVSEGQPAVGYWYDKKFFKYLSDFIGFECVSITDQPSFMMNCNHRFDVVFKK